MLDAAQWRAQMEVAGKTWLVLGEGASPEQRGQIDSSRYVVVAPDRLAAKMPVDAAVLSGQSYDGDTAAALEKNARYWLAPAPALDGLPAAREMEQQGRLVRCDQAPADAPEGAAATIWLLASLGARRIRTLGVDFNAGRPPAPVPAEADRQADSVAVAIRKYELDCGPLTAQTPARVFIGTDETQLLGAKVLEYSIRQHSSLTVTFDTMQHVKVPMPRDPKNQPRTEFSFSRFAIPALAGWQGRGLYLDADMLVFHDLRELWEWPFGTATTLYAPSSSPKRSKQTSVMLLDCDRLRWDVAQIVRDLDDCRYDYHGLMNEIALEPPDNVQAALPSDWNSLEEYVPGRTRLLHYTDTNTQPWVSRRNPNGGLWMQALCDALADGFVTEADIREAAALGHVRPSLPMELRVRPERRTMFRRVVAPVVDACYKPHRKLRQRLGRKPL
jgi:hypothetical protein